MSKKVRRPQATKSGRFKRWEEEDDDYYRTRPIKNKIKKKIKYPKDLDYDDE